MKWHRYATRSIVIPIWIRAVFMQMLHFWVNCIGNVGTVNNSGLP